MMTNCSTAASVRQASRAPPIAAISDSSRNGSMMYQFEAPTRRMIPISRRREYAAIRMVLPICSAAASRSRALSPTVAQRARFSQVNIGSRILRRSCTNWTPGIPLTADTTPWYSSGFFSFTRNESCILSTVVAFRIGSLLA